MRKLAEALKVSVDYLSRDDIDDPTYGIEKQPYVEETREMFGEKAAREIDFLMERNVALFAGGSISQEAKEYLAKSAGGDVRKALNAIDFLSFLLYNIITK